MFQQGQKAFAALSELNILLDDLRDITTGEVKIGIPPLIGTLFFPEIARSFQERYPKVSLELVELGAKLIEKLVEEGEIDLGIVVFPPVKQNSISTPSLKTNSFYSFMKSTDLPAILTSP